MHKVLMGIAGVVILGGGVFLMLQATKSNRVGLEGKILKVRTMSAGDGGTLVVADFRVQNTSRVPFVVEDVELILENPSGAKAAGRTIAKTQMELVFRSKTLIGGKYNDVLAMQDRVAPGQSMDRTAAARFEVQPGSIDARKSFTLRLTEIDGAVSELFETGLR